MSSLFSYILYLLVLFIYIDISQCLRTAGLADGSFSLGFKVDFVSDVAIAQTASVASSFGTNTLIYGDVGIGEVAVTGELPVLETTLISGQIPLFGAARFDEDLSAAESVFFNVESGFENIDGVDIMYLFGD